MAENPKNQLFQRHNTSVNGYGTYTLTAGGTWIYTLDNANAAVQALNNGQNLSDSFTVTTVDGTAQTISISIKGSNDNAVISGTRTGIVVEAGGVANGTPGTPVAAGVLTDTDVDDPADSFTAQGPTASAHGLYQIDVAGHWRYVLNNTDPLVESLNAGVTLTDTFTVAAADGTPQAIVVTILGANDNAVVTSGLTGVVKEAGGVPGTDPGVPVVTGILLSNDKDNSANAFQPIVGGVTLFGKFDIAANGAWTYVLDNGNLSVEALGYGGTLTDKFTVFTVDGTPQVVVVTIQGNLDIKVGEGPSLVIGVVVSDTTSIVQTFGGPAAATAQDSSFARNRIKFDPIGSMADALGTINFDDNERRGGGGDARRGFLSGTAGGVLSRVGFVGRLGDYSLEFGGYDFGEYRFQMGRLNMVQQVTGRGVAIVGGDVSVSTGANVSGQGFE